MQTEKKTFARYNRIDTIRGWNLVGMILYHAAWDLVYLCGMGWKWYQSEWAYVWQQSICWIFILLSGFCWSFGGKNRIRKLRRGGVVLGASALVSLVTALALPQERIVFGVLTLLGSCMLLMIPLDPLISRIRPAAGMTVSLACFLLLRNVNGGQFGFEALRFGQVPQGCYRNLLTAYLGFPGAHFFSTDYFSLIPWGFLFLSGYFLYRILEKRGKLELFCGGRRIFPLTFLGRHSLLIYLLHQPVLYILFMRMMAF